MLPSIGGVTLPHWTVPFIVVGVVGFFLYEAIRGSSAVARVFGKVGLRIRERATRAKRMEERLEHMQNVLDSTADGLECATAYLVCVDTPYHHEADLIIAQAAPHVTKLLPQRVTYLDFSRRWREGYRPLPYRCADG